MSAHEHAEAHGHHRNYVKIWAILVGLLVISVLGPMTGIRVVMLITAFGVAAVKAYMVAKNFMHLDIEKPIIRWVLAIAVVFMVLMYAGIAPDVQKSDGQNWKKDAGFHHLPPQKHHESGHAGEAGSETPAHEEAAKEQPAGATGH